MDGKTLVDVGIWTQLLHIPGRADAVKHARRVLLYLVLAAADGGAWELIASCTKLSDMARQLGMGVATAERAVRLLKSEQLIRVELRGVRNHYYVLWPGKS